jgi:hypothetical protein
VRAISNLGGKCWGGYNYFDLEGEYLSTALSYQTPAIANGNQKIAINL